MERSTIIDRQHPEIDHIFVVDLARESFVVDSWDCVFFDRVEDIGEFWGEIVVFEVHDGGIWDLI